MTPYFTFSKARSAIRKNIKTLPDTKLQKHMVLLRDYDRYINDTTPSTQKMLIEGGYFVGAKTHVSSGMSPKDIFMCVNVKHALEEAFEEMKMRRNSTVFQSKEKLT